MWQPLGKFCTRRGIGRGSQIKGPTVIRLSLAAACGPIALTSRQYLCIWLQRARLVFAGCEEQDVRTQSDIGGLEVEEMGRDRFGLSWWGSLGSSVDFRFTIRFRTFGFAVRREPPGLPAPTNIFS